MSTSSTHDPMATLSHGDRGINPATLLPALRGLRPPRRTRVAVLGAGIAGLVAAHELRRMGFEVTVFERSTRVGGRVFTHRFPGSPHLAELGAMRIPAEHRCVLHYVAEMGLSDKLIPFRTLFQNERGPPGAEEWPSLPHGAPPRTPASAWVAELVSARLAAIVRATSPAEINHLFMARVRPWLDGTLAAELRGREREPEIQRLLHASPAQLVQRLLDMEQCVEPSFRLFLRDILLEVGEDLYCLAGGMAQLPERLAAGLGSSLCLAHEVVSIRGSRDHVQIGVRSSLDGRATDIVFDDVICTLPPPAMGAGVLSSFSDRKKDALRRVRYASATKVVLHCRERFWESAPRAIDAGGLYAGEQAKGMYVPDRRIHDDAGEGPGGTLLASYTIGTDSDAASRHPDTELVSLVKSDIARRFPAIERPGMILGHRIIHWQKEAGFLGGCSVMWPASYPDARRLDALFEDLRAPDGRVYFAGEHCSSYRAWMEGAILSSLRCVQALAMEAAKRDGARKAAA